MILGNLEGIRKTILKKLDDIYEFKVDRQNISNEEIIDIICEVTSEINKEISVAIDRKGNVLSVAVGDSNTVEMPIIDIKSKKLSGVRIIHTHPNGNSKLSALDLSALISLKLDCMVAVAVENGKCKDITMGFCGIHDNKLVAEVAPNLELYKALGVNILTIIKNIEENLVDNEVEEDKGERAILVGIENEESLDELEELAKACNVVTLDKILQKRIKIDTAFFIGEGKVEELSMLRQACNANLIIFDDELAASQIRNLENATGTKVIDRTTLILEIFARRARTKEAKIQVELAQLKYRLPRLIGMGTVLSRTGAGIGTRGPGEKKLEIDKRHIRERIYDLNKELSKIKKTRQIQRDKRSRENIPKVSLVGYTNAGKSTLRNKLCEIASPKDVYQKEEVFEADMLFATLDVTTRALILPDNRLITLTDTVGFIRKLPHDLVEAFKSTLEEVINSELLLHVVDASSESACKQIEAVNLVLEELGAADKPMILLLNKVDTASNERLSKLKEEYNNLNILEISGKSNINLDLLLEEICKVLPNPLRKVEYLIPYSDSASVALLHRSAKVIEEEYEEQGTRIIAMVDDEIYNKCKAYIKNNI
ncbi:GTPase HflX [Clostridium botulinum]|uniref:GTPase HflX n=1 Tax=Clostridium botulinum TaxID=1491 RepID=A0A9Q1ZBQ8_CLOBO|nr:GTPase HflX [Clostridium botulinum]KEI02207.1 GTP-binding protein [Clostridium botulinum D str. 16868]KEI02459.1 GTP-binding protein [Clostridium botulinum C/D str. Sp77]KLU76461.1 GTP-binding protein [Clostridium botulinum V891]KOA73116.1 GTP-binding protein [Clostridium botulinum]KOA77716.1 GTP-binding protein [Clostridium botulinum]